MTGHELGPAPAAPLPSTETPMPCPLDGCDFVHVHVQRHVPAEFLAEVFGQGVVAAIQPNREQHDTERTMREHFRTHKLEDFLTTITRLRIATGEATELRALGGNL